MARSKQSKATPTLATTSARRTQTSPINSEDPPRQDARRPRTSIATGNIRNNQATQQNDGGAQDEVFNDEDVLEAKARIRALARGASTVAHAEKGIKDAKQAIKDSKNEPAGDIREGNLKLARYELEAFRRRRDELKAALSTTSAADNNAGRAGKGKGKATAGSLPASRSRPAANAPETGVEDQDASEDEAQQPTLRRSPRNRSGRGDGQASRRALNTAGPRHGDKTSPRQKWKHVPGKWWKVRGIKRESGKRYLVAWRPTGGVKWLDSWQGKSLVNSKTKRDWNRRKRDRKLWDAVDGESEVEYL